MHEEDSLLVDEVLDIGAGGAAVVAFVPVSPASRCGRGYNGQGSECCSELHFERDELTIKATVDEVSKAKVL